MDQALTARIDRAKYLLQHIDNAAMATVNIDGSPHNTPFYLIHDANLEHIYWASHPASLHSQNAVRTGQIFVVLYDNNAGGGLYIKAHSACELSGPEFHTALAIYNQMRQATGRKPVLASSYQAPNQQRLYSAVPAHFYVNVSIRGQTGETIRDERIEIKHDDLG